MNTLLNSNKVKTPQHAMACSLLMNAIFSVKMIIHSHKKFQAVVIEGVGQLPSTESSLSQINETERGKKNRSR